MALKVSLNKIFKSKLSPFSSYFQQLLFFVAFIALIVAKSECDEIAPSGDGYNFELNHNEGMPHVGVFEAVNKDKPEETMGSLTYTSPDGTVMTFNYTANEDGFFPSQEALPLI